MREHYHFERLGIDAERICRQAPTLHVATERLMKAYTLANADHLGDAMAEAFSQEPIRALAREVLEGVDGSSIRNGVKLLKLLEAAVVRHVNCVPPEFREDFEAMAFSMRERAA